MRNFLSKAVLLIYGAPTLKKLAFTPSYHILNSTYTVLYLPVGGNAAYTKVLEEMIRLGKLTDYAVAVMAQIAKEGAGQACSAHQLSEKTGIPEPTVAKVLKKLAGALLLESVRGAAGGYRLLRDPSRLTLCDVIEAMDGPIVIVSCLDETTTACGAAHACPTHRRWTPVNTVIRGALKKITLADMAADSGAAAVANAYDVMQAAPRAPLVKIGHAGKAS